MIERGKAISYTWLKDQVGSRYIYIMSIKTIKDIINKPDSEYNHETPDVLRSKEFARAYKSYVKSQIKPYGYELVNFNAGWCECSGFITNGIKYVYFNSGDYRASAPYCDIFESVLIRRAKDERDYRGETNNFCRLERLGVSINELMENR